jgi:hypothetical protein
LRTGDLHLLCSCDFPVRERAVTFFVSSLSTVGKKTLVPGFEAICTVKGNLEDAFHAAALRTSPTGVKHKEVDASNDPIFFLNV